MKGDNTGLMDQNTLKAQFDAIRDNIDRVLQNDPSNLNSKELLELTRQLDILLVEQLKKSG
ncbi:MAG TPA: hypothetical protein PK684_02920 [Bacillota bacterium]|nr:hypothetical protein [Bacillota bacterium]